MRHRFIAIPLCLIMHHATMHAQTPVTTTGGTANTIPLYTDSATLGSSVLTEANGNLGVGLPNPAASLHVFGTSSVGGYLPALNLHNGSFQNNGQGGVDLNFINDYAQQSSNVGAKLRMIRVGAWNQADLAFFTNNIATIGDVSTEKMRLTSAGNLGIGTATPGATLEVKGSTKVDGNLTLSGQGASILFPDGTIQNGAWDGVLPGGDYAESVDVSGDRDTYEPGDVLVADSTKSGRFLKSSEPYSTAVTGVFSTKPGVVGRRQTSDRSHMKQEVPMAMVGVIPTKVNTEGGPIKPGDLLVTSSTPGYAMKGTDRSLLAGAIIGKALGKLDTGSGVIEVAVSIQ